MHKGQKVPLAQSERPIATAGPKVTGGTASAWPTGLDPIAVDALRGGYG